MAAAVITRVSAEMRALVVDRFLRLSSATPELDVHTAYPHDGRVDIDVVSTAARVWELALRVPAWCDGVSVEVDGVAVDAEVRDGAVRIARDWDDAAHHVTVDLAMPVTTVAAHPRVDAVRGCVAVVRGPVVNAVEQTDVPEGVVLEDLRLHRVVGARAAEAEFAAVTPVVVDLELTHVDAAAGSLYGVTTPAPATDVVTVSAVPYHRRGNRRPGAMRVFIPTA